MFALLVSELTNVPNGSQLGPIGENTLHSHENEIPDVVRSLIIGRTRMGDVSFFVLEGWETYAVSNNIPSCLKMVKPFLEKIRRELGSNGIGLKVLAIRYSKTSGLWSYFLPYLGGSIALCTGYIGEFTSIIILSLGYMVFATLIEGRERIYSGMLLMYYGLQRQIE